MYIVIIEKYLLASVHCFKFDVKLSYSYSYSYS